MSDATILPFRQPSPAAPVDQPRRVLRLPERRGRVQLPTVRQMQATCAAVESTVVTLRRSYPSIEAFLRSIAGGYPTRTTTGADGRGHGHSDPVGELVASGTIDGIDADVVEDLLDLEAIAALLVQHWSRLARKLPGAGGEEHRALDDLPAGAGHCRCCGRWVPGTNKDRIRAGFCPADHKALLRWRTTASDPTAVEVFIVDRRRQLADVALGA